MADNSHPEVKLELRRHFLRAYHSGKVPPSPRPSPPGEGGETDARVFDAFQGGGVIWGTLGKEFSLASYWGIDFLEKKGRIKLDSARVLAQTGWRENVIDLDAYGSPWAHYSNMLRTADHSLTVFLTIGISGRARMGKRELSKLELRSIGITFDIPPAISSNLNEFAVSALLARACGRFEVVECIEAGPCTTARYFGMRLELKAAGQKDHHITPGG
jgi:hypothetical protein